MNKHRFCSLLVITILSLLFNPIVFADSTMPQQRINESENLGERPVGKSLSHELHNAEKTHRNPSGNHELHLGKPLPRKGNQPYQPKELLHSPPGSEY